METQKFSYDNKITKAFAYATIFWGIVGFIVGLTVASLLFIPTLPEFFFVWKIENATYKCRNLCIRW